MSVRVDALVERADPDATVQFVFSFIKVVCVLGRG